GVWRDAEEFIGTRKFKRFEPLGSRELAEEGIKGWQRAVRATLGWAQDRGAGGKGGKGARKTRKGVKPGQKTAKASARKTSTKPAAKKKRRR
ncbi:MAG: hypothetical protein ABIS15_06715, partial [Gemmatimonadaceae bacterium]